MTKEKQNKPQENVSSKAEELKKPAESAKEIPAEIGGRKGPEPTRYGDWENGGKCVDF